MAEFVMRITGVAPALDGDYPLELSSLSNRDLHDVKRIANVRSKELSEAFERGDTDLFVAFAIIALRHAGKSVSEDVIWEAPVSSLNLIDGDPVEEEELPPTSAPLIDPQSGLGGGGDVSAARGSSGPASRSDAVQVVNGQNGTGTLHSVTGATSPLEMSAT